jgi:hypothetical protein
LRDGLFNLSRTQVPFLSCVEIMESKKYKLRIILDRQYINCAWIQIYHFSVINMEIATFPKNFIVNLPKNSLLKSKTFAEAFPVKDTDTRISFAIQLLNEALQNPEYMDDLDIKSEIEARIKLLSPKQTVTVTCKGCGTHFERIIGKGKVSNYCGPCREAYYQKFQKVCGCGKTFIPWKGSEFCQDCRKERKALSNYQKIPRNLPTPKLAFLPRNVREAFKQDGF